MVLIRRQPTTLNYFQNSRLQGCCTFEKKTEGSLANIVIAVKDR